LLEAEHGEQFEIIILLINFLVQFIYSNVSTCSLYTDLVLGMFNLVFVLKPNFLSLTWLILL